MKYDLVPVSHVSLKCSLAGKEIVEFLSKDEFSSPDGRLQNSSEFCNVVARVLFVCIGVRKLTTKVLCD